MITALWATMKSLIEASHTAARCWATRYSATSPATVTDPSTTNAATATASPPPDRPACEIEAAAARVRARFFPIAVEVPELVSSASPETSNTITLTTTRPTIHPRPKAGPVVRARGVPSIRITAMIGTGLSATPIGSGRTSPIARPTSPHLSS
jgi:hypothetical protein